MREFRGCSLYTSELLTFPSLVLKMALIGKTDSTNGSMALVFYIQGKRFVKIKQSAIFKEFDGKSTSGRKKNPIFFRGQTGEGFQGLR